MPVSFLDRLSELIAQAEERTAVELLRSFLKEKDRNLYNETLLNLAFLNDVVARTRRGTLGQDQADIKMANLRDRLLNLLDEVKRKFGDGALPPATTPVALANVP